MWWPGQGASGHEESDYSLLRVQVTRRVTIHYWGYGIKVEPWPWIGSSVSTHASSTRQSSTHYLLLSTIDVLCNWCVMWYWFVCFASVSITALKYKGSLSNGALVLILMNGVGLFLYLNWQNLHSYSVLCTGGLKGRLWCCTIQDDPVNPGYVLKVTFLG